MGFPETLQVPGEVRSPLGAVSSLTFTVTYSKYRPPELEVHGILTQRERHPLELGFPGWTGDLEVWGQLPSGQVLRLEQAWMEGVRRVELDLGCVGFTYGIESPLDLNDGRYWVVVAIPYTEVADIECSQVPCYLGKIESERANDDGIKWPSAIGEALLADFYHYEPQFAKGEVLTRIKTTEICFHGQIEAHMAPPQLVRQVAEAIKESLSFLSFLSRKGVQW